MIGRKLTKKKNFISVALCCIVVLIVFASAVYIYIDSKHKPQPPSVNLVMTLDVYEKNNTTNIIIWRVQHSEWWNGKNWDELNASVYVNGTFYCNVSLPPGTINDDDLIVTYIPLKGTVDLIIQCKKTGGLGGSAYVYFY